MHEVSLKPNRTLQGLPRERPVVPLPFPRPSLSSKEQMQKQRKTVKQDKIIIAMKKKSRIFSSSSSAIDNTLSHILALQILKPPGEGS